MSYHSLHDIDLKQVPFHNNNEQINVQCVCILTLALSRMRSDNIAIMSRDPLWCDSWLMYCRSDKA